VSFEIEDSLEFIERFVSKGAKICQNFGKF
jgi:hypothetical protein